MLRDERRCSSAWDQSFECTRVNFMEMSGTAASMGDYGHSDVIKEECEAALSLCVHCVCMLVQHKDFVDPRTLWLKFVPPVYLPSHCVVSRNTFTFL